MIPEEKLNYFKKQARAVIKQGNEFADTLDKWQKVVEKMAPEIMKIQTTDKDLIKIRGEMDRLSERLGL